MIDKIQQHFGFTQMPFGRDLPPAMLHRHAAHAQAAARITWTMNRPGIDGDSEPTKGWSHVSTEEVPR
jgi:type II secretory pathway predicted ATPase ExeA